MKIEAKANNRRLFLVENGGPMILCSRRIDKAGLVFIKLVLFKKVVLLLIVTLSDSSMVTSWTSTLKDAGSNLLEIFIFSH